MRDDFSNSVKQKLAERVAWKCCFPGCNRITIGPSHENEKSVVKLGEAAHILAASKGGPRYDPQMSVEERASINNAIWMCRQHAKLIDSDYTIYSAVTIRQWKIAAENATYKKLYEISSDDLELPLTLISIGSSIIFEGFWKSANNNSWVFTINNFIIGSIELIKEYSVEKERKKLNNYIIIEAQGDGRILASDFSWDYVDNKYQIKVSVQDKEPREDPAKIGADIGLDEDGDLDFEDGDFKMISGIDCAKQTIVLSLGCGFGALRHAPAFGSYFSKYYWQFKDNIQLLTRMLKMEVARLVSIPMLEPNNPTPKPALNFINRILEVQILDVQLTSNRLPINLKLEWGTGEQWSASLKIYVGIRSTSEEADMQSFLNSLPLGKL